MKRKYYLITSLVVHSWNFYSPPVSSLYTSSKVIVFLQLYSIPRIPNWWILCSPNGPTDPLLFLEFVVGEHWLIFLLHTSFLLLLPLVFSINLYSYLLNKIYEKAKRSFTGVFNLFSVKNTQETLEHVVHRSDQILVVSACDSTSNTLQPALQLLLKQVEDWKAKTMAI